MKRSPNKNGNSEKTPAPALSAQQWPADQVERRDVASLVPYAKNARLHSPEQIDQLVASVKEWGWTTPVLLDEQGGIIAGHGRVLAAKKLKLPQVPCMVARGWTDAQKRAYVIADNKLTLNAGWDDALLKVEFADLSLAGFDLGLTGFTLPELTTLNAAAPTGDADLYEQEGDAPGSPEDKERGALLARMEITIADPKHVVVLGDRFLLSERHHLLVVGVMKDWQAWRDLLEGDAIFCPYPGPFTVFGDVPQQHVLVMVQPDPYVAGHILDRYQDAHGAKSIRKMS